MIIQIFYYVNEIEKTKMLLDTSFKNFDFKDNEIILLCITYAKRLTYAP